MAGNEAQHWREQIEEILESLGVGEEQQLITSFTQHLKACFSRIDAFFGILDRVGEAPGIDPDRLIPPDAWSNIFRVIFQTLLEAMPAERACMAAFMIGELWKMHERELLDSDY